MVTHHDRNYKEKGIVLEGMYGIKGESLNPYLKAKYTTNLNHCSKYRDGWGTVGVGVYKQCTEKFGINLEIDYTQTTNIVKEDYIEGCLDARIALAENCALKLGYAFQLSDSQHSFKSEYLLPDWIDDKTNFKSKSRNRFFATLSYAF